MISNLIFRPVSLNDLDQIYDLSKFTQTGMTSLPINKSLLKDKILLSEKSFSKKVDSVSDEYYLFVLEDITLNKVIGVSAILASVGIGQPFLTFDIKTVKTASKQLDLNSSYDIFSLKKQYNGPSELLTLFLHPDYRKSGIGRFLSLVRFLFIKQHQLRFKQSIIAEIRGDIDANGCSLFYDVLIKPYLKMSFDEADKLSQIDKSFLIDLLPKAPFFIDVVEPYVNYSIGKAHHISRLAMSILESEGLKKSMSVDVLDAGPKIKAKLNNVRVFSQIKLFKYFNILDKLDEKTLFMVSSGKLNNFRACIAQLDDYDKLAILDSPSFRECLKQGNQLSYVRLYPKSRQSIFYKMNLSTQKKLFKTPFLKEFSLWYQERLPSHQKLDKHK